MKETWLKVIQAVREHPDFRMIASKRIANNLSITVDMPTTQTLTLDMLGYQKKKLTMLKDYYYHEESIAMALTQLEYRRKGNSYGSTGVTTYAHLAKRERPMHGPCIQSIIFTHANKKVDTHVFYRTTEAVKKFGADLIFLQEYIFPLFAPNGKLTFTFANATLHPMYWATMAPYLDDPMADLRLLAKSNPSLHRATLRWIHRFLHNQDSLMGFKQGHRVARHLKRLMDPAHLEVLTKYTENVKGPINDEPTDDEPE